MIELADDAVELIDNDLDFSSIEGINKDTGVLEPKKL